jgi:hypothetical protein
MSERKIIQVNPELFKIPDKKMRKPKNPKNTAKIVPKMTPKHNKSLKNSVLRMIRNKQDSYKKMLESPPTQTPTANTAAAAAAATHPNHHKDVQQFHSDFEDSLKFANDFIKQQEHSSKNKTLKRHQGGYSDNINPIINDDVFENVYAKMPISNAPLSNALHNTSSIHLPSPQWGCLKGGNLMTYRAFHNKTAKNTPPQIGPLTTQSFSGAQVPQHQSKTPVLPFINTPVGHGGSGGLGGGTGEYSTETLEKMKRSSEKEKKLKRMPKLKYKKRKKTLRRTYNVGRSKYFPKIGVLISNQTIRNKTTEKIQLLKQTPIQEIRKFLIKRGFIKIGTLAPNDLLRKMYESVQLVCGEIQNHNPENLLYNFLNDR